MIVLDASTAVELLFGSATGTRVAARIADPSVPLCAPHLIDVEVLHVLRRYALQGALAPIRAREALDDWSALDVQRYPHEPLLERMWELRDNLSAYDAAYVALAEMLDAVLLTTDARLAGARHRARVELITAPEA